MDDNNTEKVPTAEAVAEEKKPVNKDLIIIGLKLLIITTVIAALLAVVNMLTADRIAQNEAEKLEAMIKDIFPQTDKYITVDGADETTYEIVTGGQTVGYCVYLVPSGFGGAINLLVGCDLNGVIAGVKVVSHSETPGLGSRIAEQTYLDAYTGKSGNLTLNGNIDAVAGSTISSQAVLNGVNDALAVIDSLFQKQGVK